MVTLRIVGIARRAVVAALVIAGAAAAGCGEDPAEEPAEGAARPRRPIADGLDTGLVDSLSGAPGILDRASGTYRLAVPRDDLIVTVDGVRLTPRMGLEGEVVFDPVPGGAVMTARLPVLADEANPVISAALLHGLGVTGLHSHFAHDEPRLKFLHLAGIGETDSLAAAVGAVLQTLEDVKRQPRVPPAPIDPAASALDAAAVDSVLGLRGETRGGAYRVTIPRPARFDGYEIGAASGLATRLTLVGTDDRAAASGYFALVESELQGVLRALRAGGLEIVGIAPPLVGTEPPLVFVHFWGRGRAVDLAQGLRDALEVVRPPAE